MPVSLLTLPQAGFLLPRLIFHSALPISKTTTPQPEGTRREPADCVKSQSPTESPQVDRCDRQRLSGDRHCLSPPLVRWQNSKFTDSSSYPIKEATGPFHSQQAHTQDGRWGVRQQGPFISTLLGRWGAILIAPCPSHCWATPLSTLGQAGVQ